MIKNINEERRKGLAVTVILGLFVIGIAVFMWLIFAPVFDTIQESSEVAVNGTEYDQKSDSLFRILEAMSGNAIIVVPVLAVAMGIIRIAILETNLK